MSGASTTSPRDSLPAGFYYKTFIHPRPFWKHVFEPLIRRAAGLGAAPTEADPDRYAFRYAFCDVLVVGGGIAGLTAALGAAATGRARDAGGAVAVTGAGARRSTAPRSTGCPPPTG